MGYKAPKGVFDILPHLLIESEKDLWCSSEIWQQVEATIHTLARHYGYKEMRTPIFEQTELFARGVGEGTDIVSKEMYTFLDKGKRSMTLRPEGTAPAMRAAIEHHLPNPLPYCKLYYIGPMFRYERPQAGRYRQHHQLGMEVIGLPNPEVDAEIIDASVSLYRQLGIKELTVQINSLGSVECRKRYREALKEYLTPLKKELSEDSQKRLELNPLRVLDSKAKEDQEIVANAPKLEEFLGEGSLSHFVQVQKALDALEVPYEVTPNLVRGLDYYNHTVFEVITGSLGAQNSIGGGGRYDGLIETLGGKSLPSIGFATGLERVIHTLLAQNEWERPSAGPDLYVIPMDSTCYTEALRLATQLRRKGLSADVDFTGRKVKKSLALANTLGARHVAVLGEEELASGKIQVKEMATREERTLPLERFAEKFINKEETIEA